ncbi:F-type conjugal transfer pilus assembly protein TraB [Kluyvera ascorbata]
MNLNENLKTRRKQLAILAAVIMGGGAATGGIIWYGQHQQAQKQPAPVATPNMTGVVTAAFNQQVNDAALAQQQAKTSALEQNLATLSQQFEQNKLNTEQQLARKDEEIQRLNDQLTKAPGSNATTGQQAPPAGPNGTPLPGPVAAGQARPPEYMVTPAGSPAATGVNMGQGTGFYPGGSGQRMTGGLSTTRFSYDSLKKKPTKLPWIPSGSFSDAVMIEGADANASVTGQQNTQPVTIRLLGNIQMPNNKEYSADGCFVVGEIWGDISSERGVVRTKSISCVLKNGKHVDMAFDGHVSYQGKGGVRGKPVMRNGMIVGYAGAAGLLSGFGEGIKSAATPSVGLGATADVTAGDVLKQGFGGGASKAADTLSQYWIKRAEQYHPVIDIGAGNFVTVVFQKGFRLETLEDTDEEKAKDESQKASNAAGSVAEPRNASQTTASSTASVGNINPDDVLRQASQLRLGDTIN